MADLTINENTYIGFTANKTETEAKADKSSNRMNICKNKKLYLNGERLGLTDEEAAALQNGQSGGGSGSGSGTDYSDEIAALQSTVSGHTSSIQLMQTKNNEQDVAITSLRNKDAAQDTNIETLQSKVAALEAGGSSGSGSGTVSWAIDLGESDNSSNSDMPYKAPSRAADPAIAGDKNIRRILFTATDGEKTYGAYIEQVVYEKACVQMMFINGRRFDRFIDFTDYNRTEINTATSVGGIQPWQRTDPRNLSYNASTRKLALSNMWGQNIGNEVQLPLSTASADGLMPAGTLTEISQLKSDVATLRNTVEAGGSSGSGSSGSTTDTAQLNAELTVLEQCLLGGQLVEIAGFAPEGTTLTTGSTTLSPTPISCPVYFVPGTTGMNGGFGVLNGGSYWANWLGAGSWPKDNYPSVGSTVAYETGTSTVYLIKSTLTGWTYTRIGATDKATFEAIRDRYATVNQHTSQIQALQQADAEIIERLNTADSDIQANLDANVANEGSIIALQGRADTHDKDIAKLKSDVALLQSGSGSSDGVDAAQMEAEVKMLERCLLGGALVEIASVIPASLTQSAIILDEEPSSCKVYFVEGSSASDSGFGFRPGIQPTYYSDWNATGKYAKSNYNPVNGMVLAYNVNTQKLFLFQQDMNETIGWKYHLIGATDKATFDAIRARYTAVEELRTTTAGHETRIATLETDVAALKAGSGSSGSGSSGTTAEVLKVDVGALDSLCSSVEVAKSLIQHPEKMRYVVTTTSGGVTIAVGELVMYADAGGKQVTQELSSHYLITGNNISSGSVRLDAANTFCRSFGVLSNAHSTTGSWTKWKPKGGILDIGISDINSNSAIRMNVPSLLQNALVCGNLYVARVLFTIKLTSNGNTYSGAVDQIVSGSQCVQRMQLNGRLFTRSIDFTDASRGTVSFVQPWQDSEARNLSYNKSTGAIGMANMWGDAVGQSATIPVSDDTYKGLVPAGTLSKLGTLYGAQQRTWALNEPALQFDFFEKNKLDNTMLTSNGYDTSFFLFKFSKTYGAGINTSDVNPNVVIHVDTACPTSYTYNGVTYTSISRYIAVFRKYNRKGRHKYHGDEQNRYYSKKKSGYIEFLGNKYIAGSGLRSQFYSENFSPIQNSGDFYFSNVHQIISQLRCREPNHKYITLPHAAHNHLFQQVTTGSKEQERFVDTLKIGLCLVLECKKSGYRPVYIYGPMIKGRLISTYYVNNLPCEMKFNRS